MIPIAYRKLIIILILAGAIFSLYDWILHGLLSLIHILLLIVHMAFEWFEYTLEHLIEHVFHTTRKQSQIIVFYLLLFMGLGVAYYFFRKLPGWYRDCEAYFLSMYWRFKSYLVCYWQGLPSTQKIKVLTSCSAGISCLIFFSF
ncbi:MAG: hypothetical protein ACXW1W_04635 [Methylococcaceae bacterium]